LIHKPETASSFIAGKPAPTGFVLIVQLAHNLWELGLPAMAADQTTKIPGTKKPAIIH
jgi:hypothetical protein